MEKSMTSLLQIVIYYLTHCLNHTIVNIAFPYKMWVDDCKAHSAHV